MRIDAKIATPRLPLGLLALLPLLLFGACSNPDSEPAEAGSEPANAPVDSPAPAKSRGPAESDAGSTDSGSTGVAPAEAQSVYTEIAEANCRVALFEEPPASELDCPGPVGFSLLAHDEDARVSISIVDAAGVVLPLEFWRTVTGSFSALGPRAEWRLVNGQPTALIVRVNAYEDPEDPDKTTSYLVVAKITAGATCVVAKIPPSAEQNQQARDVADTSAERACL